MDVDHRDSPLLAGIRPAGFRPEKGHTEVGLGRCSAFLAPILVVEPIFEIPTRSVGFHRDAGNRLHGENRSQKKEKCSNSELAAPFFGPIADRIPGQPWTMYPHSRQPIDIHLSYTPGHTQVCGPPGSLRISASLGSCMEIRNPRMPGIRKDPDQRHEIATRRLRYGASWSAKAPTIVTR